MKNFTIHQKHHYGWTKDTFQVNSLNDAVKQSVLKYHDFLEKEYSGEYRIEHNIGKDKYPEYSVIWDNSKKSKGFALTKSVLVKGDLWFSDRILHGQPDDCTDCGGTGVNRYNPWMQCYGCGDENLEGKGTGKEVKK